MKVKCLECGLVFDSENAVDVTEHHGEPDAIPEVFSVCPCCGGGYEEVCECEHCGDVFFGEDLYDGYCGACLRNAITYKNALEFMEADCKAYSFGYLEEFAFEKILNLDSRYMRVGSSEAKKVFRELYLRKVANEKLCGGKEFLDTVRSWIMNDDCAHNYIEREFFAEWLNEHEDN